MEEAVNNQRSIIFFLRKKGQSGADIHKDLKEVFGDSAISKKTVYNWIEKFDAGQLSVEDAPRSGRPSTSVTDTTSSVSASC